MSYILDALKRADAERERGHVPGLHTRSALELDAPVPPSARVGARAWLIALVLLLALGALLWWWLRAASPMVVAPEPTPSPITQPSAPSVAADIPPQEPTDRLKEAHQSPAAALPILAPEIPRSPVKTGGLPRPAKAAEANPASVASPAASSTAPAGAVRSFAELNAEARARLPAVNVSGSTYSKDPTRRMLILNGKVLQEGGEIGPGFVVETIEPRSAVLNHQGLRYRIGY